MSVLKGIPFLRQELTKIFMKRAADRSGIMKIPFKNKDLQLDIEDRVQKYIRDAEKQGVDLDMVSNADLKYTINLNENPNPLSRAISADSPEGRAITEKLLGKRGEVVDMAGKKLDTSQGIMGGKSVKELMDSGQVTKGARGMKKSKKVQDRKMFQDANKRLKTDVNKIIADIKAMDPMDSMKEANSVIGRKGVYKNLTPEESKKILKDTEDHIFERDIPEEDFADGGVAGLLGERTGYFKGALADTKKGKAMSPGTTASGEFKGGNNNTNNNPPPIQTNNSPETITFSDVTGKKMTAADRLAKQKFINYLNAKKVYSSGENEEADDLYDAYSTATGLDNFQKNVLIDSTTNQLVNQIDGNTKNFYNRNSTIKDLDTGDFTKQLVVQTPTNFTRRIVRPSGIMENDIAQPFGAPQSLSVQPYADGGPARQNFKMGKRAFLKAMLGTGAGIAGLKSGLFATGGKEVTKKAVTETVKQSASTPPPYFFKLAEKIKKLGSDTTPTNDRTIAKSLKSKDGKSDYILEEDVSSGDTIIKKVNKEGDEMITDVQIMELRKGEVVRGKDGKPKKTPDEYEEVTEANARIEGDVFNDPYYSDGIEIDDILREVDDIPVPKASGGIARMLGE